MLNENILKSYAMWMTNTNHQVTHMCSYKFINYLAQILFVFYGLTRQNQKIFDYLLFLKN